MTSSSIRTGVTAGEIKQSFLDNMHCALGRSERVATKHNVYYALALTVRDRLFARTVDTIGKYGGANARRVAYLSAEYLPGPQLANNLLSLGITEATREAMQSLGYDLSEIINEEEEPGLGNGGLGRLASCYMDSLASVEVPAIGYGIRYEFGIFDQVIRDGWQEEITDKWLRHGNAWEIARPGISYEVKFGGRTESSFDEEGCFRLKWIPETMVQGVAYDTPVLGYAVETCDALRLWKAEAVESFDFASFNHGDYYRAVQDKMRSENITKVLYPNDEVAVGKELRLKQQYFFSSCSLQDMLRIHAMLDGTPSNFHEKWAVQLNDTHPAVAVAELMRLLVDEHSLSWEEAWDVTQKTFAYTNHTLLPEALEKWSVELFGALLPRHLEIVYEINRRFLEELRAKKVDEARMARLSLIDESGGRYVRMANLATVGSHHINGVAELHSELLKQTVLKDFADLWPEKFCNVTNGVTPRRFIALSNPALTDLITQRVGECWLKDLKRLRGLEQFADDVEFQEQWWRVKLGNKQRLAALILERTGIKVSAESLFDIQVKRIHEYKRQHLAALHIVTLYLRLRRNPDAEVPARTFIFGGKAAPGYFMAKRIIKLINAIGEAVNNDPAVRDRLKVVFFPDFNVKNAHFVYPAANLSEQISTAGKEASGTGNMKFSLNGALTIGTLDGANVEIREEVGAENFFLFGLTTPEVALVKAGGYRPREIYNSNETLREVIDFIASGELGGGDADLFKPIVDNVLGDDPYMLMADYQGYIDAQERVSALWRDQSAWTRMSILNCARMGKFSSDRSIRDYCARIWNITPGQS
ncbi:MAG: glycogen/starch/alpha-glucan phosphorylase [Chthoniobacterales bacterium]